MAIKDTTAVAQEALTYDRYFMTHLSISQVLVPTDTEDLQYGVLIQYQRYAVDSKGVRHYKPDVYEVRVSDFYAKAIAEAAAGDTTMSGTLQSMEDTLALLIAEKEGVTIEKV